jgi:hypothetical protein
MPLSSPAAIINFNIFPGRTADPRLPGGEEGLRRGKGKGGGWREGKEREGKGGTETRHRTKIYRYITASEVSLTYLNPQE